MKRDRGDRLARPPRRRRGGRRQPVAHERRRARTATTTRPTRRARRRARSAATWPTNSGGPHTLKYGVTVNHVLGVELVLPDGRGRAARRRRRGPPGLRPDRRRRRLRGDVRHRHARRRCASCATRRRTARCSASSRRWTTPPRPSAASSRAGIVPAALEMMDQLILAGGRGGVPLRLPDRRRRRADHRGGRPGGGPRRARPSAIAAICRDERRARGPRRATTRPSALLLWKCRKQAFGAVGRLAPSYCTQDGVVPRTKLPRHPARASRRSAERHRLRIGNVFHAGDGNIHPILLFDERDRRPGRRACSPPATRSWRSASRSAAASPASTASASRRSRRCRCSSGPTTCAR